MPERDDVLAILERDGLLRRDGEAHRTTKRWQGAMARAAFRLYGAGDDGHDLRYPLAAALVELYGETRSEAELVCFIEALLPIEAAELDPRAHLARADPRT
jgi:hypothetical protein